MKHRCNFEAVSACRFWSVVWQPLHNSGGTQKSFCCHLTIWHNLVPGRRFEALAGCVAVKDVMIGVLQLENERIMAEYEREQEAADRDLEERLTELMDTMIQECDEHKKHIEHEFHNLDINTASFSSYPVNKKSLRRLAVLINTMGGSGPPHRGVDVNSCKCLSVEHVTSIGTTAQWGFSIAVLPIGVGGCVNN